MKKLKMFLTPVDLYLTSSNLLFFNLQDFYFSGPAFSPIAFKGNTFIRRNDFQNRKNDRKRK